MQELSAVECAHVLAAPVFANGGRWMLDPETIATGKAAGYPNGFVFYGIGRGGVLGDVDADVVVAAFGYFAPSLVRQVWETGIAVEGARAAGHRFAGACAAWGRARLGGVDGLDRFVTLAERVIDSAAVPGLPLFAGWRAEPRPDDVPARAYLCVHLLRELRGSVHIVATTAHGLSPLESMLAGEGAGPDRAKMFGWKEPFPDASGPDAANLAERRRGAEAATDELMARHLEVLTAAERGELVDLVLGLSAALDG